MHDFCRARFLSRTIFVVHESCTIVHDNRFGQAQNRARSHDKIFVVILNPDLDILDSILKRTFRVTVLLRPMLLSLTLNVWLVTPPRTKSPWTHQTLFSMPSVSLAENSMTLPSNQIWSTSPSMSSVMAVNQKSKLNTRVKTKHFSQKKFLQWFSTRWKRPLKLILAKMFQMLLSPSQPISTIHR